jgi:hypothetical protein
MNALSTHKLDSPALSFPTSLGLALGGCGLAALDLGFAIAYWALQDVPAMRVLQSIAAWTMGRDAFAGGWSSAWCGAALYALLIVGMVLAYRSASRRYRLLLRRPLLCGALYGVAMYLLVFQVVVPHFSAASIQPEPLDWTLACVSAYVLVIGMPCAKLAQWAERRQRR